MKRITGKMFLGAVVFGIAVLLSVQATAAQKEVGIILWSDAGHYLEGRDTIVNHLSTHGFGMPGTKIVVENAQGNKAKAAEITQQFAQAKMDLIITLGTTATVIAAKAISDVPIVFCMVYDPIGAKVAESWESSGNNTTGSSSMVDMSRLVAKLKELAPVKRLGVLYTPAQENSAIQLKEVQAAQQAQGIKVVPIPVTSAKDIDLIVPRAMKLVDALYLSGSSIVLEQIPEIVDIATKAKVITVAHLGNTVEKGVLMAVYGSPDAIGRIAAEKAVQILRGAKPSTIPIEHVKEYSVDLNIKTAKKGTIAVPPALLKSATRLIQ